MSQSLRIAVADDEPDILEHYQKALTRLGHLVVVAARDGRELVAGCRAVRPDLVITDIRMPPGGTDDGLRAAVAIRANHPSTSVLLLSQHVNRQYATELLDTGRSPQASAGRMQS